MVKEEGRVHRLSAQSAQQVQVIYSLRLRRNTEDEYLSRH